MKIPFLKKIVVITLQLLIQSPGKFLYVAWNLVKILYPKFVTLPSFFKIFKENFRNVKKLKKKSDGIWSMNKFVWNKKRIGHLIIHVTIIFFAIF